ncbi:MAG: YlbF family regulator [Bacilli bacterium]|nr:YlbF family regulator [Bacilli bacterium]MBQ6497994.1 YlbF family regulator [Bacilli bacterium]
MNDLIGKVDNLINSIDNTKQVQEIKKINEEIMKDEELMKMIRKYQENGSEDLKKEIINNKLFSDYKDKETELNILILELNKKLKSINDKGKCC